MAVLSNVDLQDIVENYKGIIVLNNKKNNFTGPGYDLTIGLICDSEEGKIPNTDPKKENRYILKPGHRYIIISQEYIYLSSKYMATLHSRGSYALKGLIVPSTVIDPNYKGFIVASLFNCSKKYIYVKKENQFLTMVVHQLLTPTDKELDRNKNNEPRDVLATLHSEFNNVNKAAVDMVHKYYTEIERSLSNELFEAISRQQNYNKPPKDDPKKTISDSDSSTANLNKNKARITFLVGNGFDLNAGLKTSYSDFYKYHLKRHKNDMIAKEIRSDTESRRQNWEDLEAALGKYTEKLKTKQDIKKFMKSEAILERSLKEYLSGQMEKVNLKNKDKKIVEEFHNFLVKIYSDLPDGLRKAEKEHYFISFNYTDALDQCLNVVKKNNPDEICFGENDLVLHIHGTLSKGNIVVGVDNEDQITNSELKFNDSLFHCLSKESIINSDRYIDNVKAQSIINYSDIICIFGMSIGPTDKTWWKAISKWLKEDSSRLLFIFAKDEIPDSHDKYKFECIDNMKDKFKSSAGLENDEMKEIEKQIHVKVNEDILKFKMVDVSE